MGKASGTRSGLLWEVERLLNETKYLPDILLMENVPAVIQAANIKDFHQWQDYLTGKGYINFVALLNAKDYGVGQNRERCFMMSLLGQFNYKFPDPVPLVKKLEDYLEADVEESYYIETESARKLIQDLKEFPLHDSHVRSQGKISLAGSLKPDKEGYGQDKERVLDCSGISFALRASDGGEPVKILEVEE